MPSALPPTFPQEVTAKRPWRILIVGAAYGGITALMHFIDLSNGKQRLDHRADVPNFEGAVPARGVDVTVLDERDGFFHSVGAPLAHVSKPHTSNSWKRFKDQPILQRPNVHFILGSMQQLDCAAKSATYLDITTNSQKQLDYDYVIIATGIRRQWPVVPQVSTHVEYVREGLKHVGSVAGAKNGVVVVVGGGAVGIEFAAEVSLHHPTIRTILVHSRSQLLSAEPLLPDAFKSRALKVLQKEGVEVILGQRAYVAKEQKDDLAIITLTDGRVLEAGFVIDARSTSTPSTSFLPREALTEEGYVKATHFMTLPSHVPNHASHFTIGDINDWSGIKRAGNAMSMAQIASVNVWSAMLSDEHSEKQQSNCCSSRLSESVGAGSQTPPRTADDDGVQVKALADLSLDDEKDENNQSLAPLFPQAQFPDIPAVMGLAIGSNTVTWDGTDVKWGKELMAATFGTDLGWKGTLRHMGLSSEENVEVAEIANVEKQVDEVVRAEEKRVDNKHVEKVMVEELLVSA